MQHRSCYQISTNNGIDSFESIIASWGLLVRRVAEAVLWAEAKLGELLRPLTAVPKRTPDGTFKDSLPKGITHKQSNEARQLADNPVYLKTSLFR